MKKILLTIGAVLGSVTLLLLLLWLNGCVNFSLPKSCNKETEIIEVEKDNEETEEEEKEIKISDILNSLVVRKNNDFSFNLFDSSENAFYVVSKINGNLYITIKDYESGDERKISYYEFINTDGKTVIVREEQMNSNESVIVFKTIDEYKNVLDEFFSEIDLTIAYEENYKYQLIRYEEYAFNRINFTIDDDSDIFTVDIYYTGENEVVSMYAQCEASYFMLKIENN